MVTETEKKKRKINGTKEGWGKGVSHWFQFNDRVDELMHA